MCGTDASDNHGAITCPIFQVLTLVKDHVGHEEEEQMVIKVEQALQA